MKFCPNCGNILEGKIKCDCGFDTLTEEVDKNKFKDFKNRENSLYDQSCDNISLMHEINEYDIVDSAKMMGMNPYLSNKEILNQLNSPIFNKDNDNLFGKELDEILKKANSCNSTEKKNKNS